MIPRVIHQTWKTRSLPKRLQAWQQTWKRHHSRWEHRLWTDEDNRNVIKRHYPWFLPLYDGYPDPIMRVDAVRYFILDHYGGLYVDLDFECLRPVDSLLENKRLVLGREPPTNVAHVMSGRVVREHTGDLIGNAWIASEKRHPFWEHVHRELVRAHGMGDALEATGPFFLTRALRAFNDVDSISIESHEVLYPAGSREAERTRRAPVDLERAYAVHHWIGTWWRRQRVTRRVRKLLRIAARTARRGRELLREARILISPGACERYRAAWGVRRSARVHVAGGGITGDRVWAQWMRHGTCVARAVVELDGVLPESRLLRGVRCVARVAEFDGAEQLRAAVDDFHGQTVTGKCLALIADHADARINEQARQLESDDVVVVQAAEVGNEMIASLRRSTEAIVGDAECAWARWGRYASHPRRLETQLAVLNALGADACSLQRRLLVAPQCAILPACGVLHDTLMCRAARADCVIRDGSDTEPGASLVLIDEPALSMEVLETVADGADDEPAGAAVWRGERYTMLVRYLRSIYGDVLPPEKQFSTPAPRVEPGMLPSVLILTPVKNAAPHITRYIENLERMDYPEEKIALAFLESDSSDGTWARLDLELPRLRERYSRVELFQKHFDYRNAPERWAMNTQFKRRAVMARSRNALLSRALRDEQWVLWMDVDLLSWPADALKRLLAAGKDVVVPHCVREDGATFDMNTFRLKEGAGQLDWSRYVYDGILQPPAGYGRSYLGEHRGLVEVDGVGGTMLLVRADLHREGLSFPPYPYRYLIETEGLAQMAKDMGHQCWGLADLTIVHVSQ